MKFFNASITYQNNGAAWLLILRGKQEHIEQAFRSLFNNGATNGELTWHTKTDPYCVATFWSSFSQMKRYYYNRHYREHYSVKHANMYAADMMMNKLMGGDNTETFMKFDSKPEAESGFSMGSIESHSAPEIESTESKSGINYSSLQTSSDEDTETIPDSAPGTSAVVTGPITPAPVVRRTVDVLVTEG